MAALVVLLRSFDSRPAETLHEVFFEEAQQDANAGSPEHAARIAGDWWAEEGEQRNATNLPLEGVTARSR